MPDLTHLTKRDPRKAMELVQEQSKLNKLAEDEDD